MSLTPLPWIAIRGFLTLVCLAGLLWGIRGATAKRPMGLLVAIGCGLFLCEQTGTLALHFFGLHTASQVKDLYRMAQAILLPLGTFALTFAALSSVRPHAKSNDTDHPGWSQGKQLLFYALISLAILPISAGLTLAMLRSRELFVSTGIDALLTIPSVVVWLLASRYLETLRVQTSDTGERPITLWAYGIASLSSLGALFCALFAFILLGLQQGWITP